MGNHSFSSPLDDIKKKQRHPWIDFLRVIDRDRETALDRRSEVLSIK